ncbi:MAG: hypothetical protein FJ030_18195 [Chloroflexi bacterium]|nr:hypothetical protein [Chloroflexota bacterium]
MKTKTFHCQCPITVTLLVLVALSAACKSPSALPLEETPTLTREEGMATEYWGTEQASDQVTDAASKSLYVQYSWHSDFESSVAAAFGVVDIVQVWSNNSQDYWFPKVDFLIEVIGIDGSVLGSETQTIFIPAGGANHFQASVSANGSRPKDVRVTMISVEALSSNHPVAPISAEWIQFGLYSGSVYRNMSQIQIENNSDFSVDIEAIQTVCVDTGGNLIDASESNHWSEAFSIPYGRAIERQVFGGHGPGFDLRNSSQVQCDFWVYYRDRTDEIGFVWTGGMFRADESMVITQP